MRYFSPRHVRFLVHRSPAKLHFAVYETPHCISMRAHAQQTKGYVLTRTTVHFFEFEVYVNSCLWSTNLHHFDSLSVSFQNFKACSERVNGEISDLFYFCLHCSHTGDWKFLAIIAAKLFPQAGNASARPKSCVQACSILKS